MNFWIDPLKGWRAAAWFAVWFSLATLLTFLAWEHYPARYVFYTAAVAVIASRCGPIWGFIVALLAVAVGVNWFSPVAELIPVHASAMLLASLMIIVLAHQAAEKAKKAKAGEAALLAIQKEREKLLETERQMRTQLELANRAKDEFLATLSHELRTPLMAILGWAQVLRQGKIGEDGLTEAACVIERSAKMQVQLIEDLLDMNRIIAGKLILDFQDVDLPEVISAAINTILPGADAKNIGVYRTFDPAVKIVRGDPARLQQCVGNLLANAIKFTPAGGRIDVTLEKSGDRVEIAVTDTGVGIERAHLAQVFDRFSQFDPSSRRRHGGLGLGLAIVRNLVELHEGSVEAFSEGEGKGSTFRILLPGPQAADTAVLPSASVPAKTDSRTELRGARILVVDDEADTRRLVHHLLTLVGATVDTAASGREAIVQLDKNRYDVLVCDIAMPEMDGYDLLRHVRSSPHRGLRAVALTANARSEDRRRAMDSGFDLVVAKPVEIEEFVATVASMANGIRN